MVAGDPGAGKTLLTLQFLAAGAKANERGLYVSLSVEPEKVIQAVKSIGMDLRSLVDAGQLHFMGRSPVNLDPDQFYWDLRELLDATPVRRVVIDSLTDLEPALDDPKRLRDYLYAMTNLFGQRRITSIITRQSMGEGEIEYDVAMVFDSIMAMRLRRMQEHLRKTLSLLKVQGTPHDTGMRTVKISNQGFMVETKFEPTSAFLRQLSQTG
jgi:circadian clock protein KaiC